MNRVWATLLVLALLVGCGGKTKPVPPPPDRTAEFLGTCGVLFQEELGREMDPSGRNECVRRAKAGETGEDLRRWIQASEEWRQVQETKQLPPALPPLEVRGREFYAGGQKFHWQYVTAFQLLDYVADQRQGEAEAFLEWAKETGFNGVRVLATAEHLFQLSGTDGRLALTEFFQMLRRYQMRVELVALADTLNWLEAQIHEQVAGVAFACSVQTACTMQLANEHWHPSQYPRLRDRQFLASLAGHTQLGQVHTQSAGPNDEEDEPGGLYFTRHLDRSRDPWNMVRRVRELEALSQRRSVPVVNNEPIGAGESHEAGRRLTNPAIFYAFGILSRIFDVGTTFHCQDCLYARIPGPVQQEAARAFIAGIRDIPTSERLSFKNTGWSDSPVESADFGCTTRIYSGVLGNRSYTVFLGLTCSPNVKWRGSWLAQRVLGERPQVQLWEVAQ